VRRDVKIAFAWDGELSGLGLEAKERYLMEVGELAMMWHIRMSSLKHEPTVTVMCGGDSLMELARFEHLTFAEQKIYMQNGGMALEVRPLSLSIFPEECVDRVSVEAAVISRRTRARHHCRIASPHSDVCLPRCLTTAGRRLLLLLLLLMDDDDAAREDEPPGPQGLWKKIICGVIVVVLTLFPAFYLLLFGVQQGKAMLKVWWISSMTGFALTAIVYEPFSIFVQVRAKCVPNDDGAIRNLVYQPVRPSWTARAAVREVLLACSAIVDGMRRRERMMTCASCRDSTRQHGSHLRGTNATVSSRSSCCCRRCSGARSSSSPTQPI
jgi:hypothetical protein